ncbi:protein-L-isoaspartate(D-aspartate) O-methyltransferase [Actinomadura craniellae]|uniref:Protein-L-isoaspartate O-methyltransferase n=1 Tax=Actinomadura craniellae TaxID=2231787 RepID=A0A365H1J8_9ACTN|nr:protein-L-isoaspartate(D-aspartate) O-methyltransferase [Actinomadura craniellae]
MLEARSRIDTLADRLAAADDLTDPRWRDALHAVPRHLFVPDRAWQAPDPGRTPRLVDRAADPEEWWEAAYADAPVITQFDDGAGEPGSGRWTSSLSAPGIVLRFLELLGLRDHDRVLEIGTGTGWTAALLSHRLGAGNVTSVEIDPSVAARAAANLGAAGFGPRLVTGNGEAGHPPGAPYDKVHVTCGVTWIPQTWVEQVRPGGTIAFPWMPEWAGGHIARLTVTGDGRAIGSFHGGASYMMLRSQRGTPPPIAATDGGGRESATRIDPRTILGDSHGADLAITARLPDVMDAEHTTGDGRYALVLADTAGTSWARVEHRPGARDNLVVQAGPRNLWDEVADAYLRWVGLGSPDRSRFGMTAGPDGQRIWLDRPKNVIEPMTMPPS